MSELGGADDGPDRDWFGYPLDRERDPVPCPRCGEGFTDSTALAVHLRIDHGLRGRRRAPDPEQPALGQNPRGAWSRRLRTIPLVVVVAVNVVAALVVVGVLSALAPPWWEALMDQSWNLVVLIPLLWPTIAFLAVRGID